MAPHFVHEARERRNANGVAHRHTYPLLRAGLPNASACGRISFVTTEPAPMKAKAPIFTPQRIVAFAPSVAPCPIRVLDNSQSATRLLGRRSFVRTTPGPMNTPLSTVTPFHSAT